MTLIASHIVSCMWYLTARLDNFSPDTWVSQKELVNSNYGEKYITCLYWTF